MLSRWPHFIPAWTFEGTTSLLVASLQAWAALPLMLGMLILVGAVDLGANPQESIIRGLGQVSLSLLIFAYAITALERIWQKLVAGFGYDTKRAKPFGLVLARRAIGLWALTYALLHLLAYWLFEQDQDTWKVLVDFFRRPFVTLGMLALLIMLALGVTSNRFSMQRLGPSWKKLHRLIGLIVVLSLLHYALHKAGKNDFVEPLAFGLVAVAAWLLKLRRPS
jgi:sulfoxide reductase heme-binding subunit YedZ